MTSDGRLPPEQRRNYSNAFVALGALATPMTGNELAFVFFFCVCGEERRTMPQ